MYFWLNIYNYKFRDKKMKYGNLLGEGIIQLCRVCEIVLYINFIQVKIIQVREKIVEFFQVDGWEVWEVVFDLNYFVGLDVEYLNNENLLRNKY